MPIRIYCIVELNEFRFFKSTFNVLWQSAFSAPTFVKFDDEVMEPQPSRIDWLKVTAQERENYYHKSKNLLDQQQVPTEVRHCQNFNCTDEKHLEEIENYYAELTIALLVAASSAIKPTGKKNEGKFNIPGWNSVVKSKHQIAKAAFRLWVNCNRPKTGDI